MIKHKDKFKATLISLRGRFDDRCNICDNEGLMELANLFGGALYYRTGGLYNLCEG